jgi:hypothetical protein
MYPQIHVHVLKFFPVSKIVLRKRISKNVLYYVVEDDINFQKKTWIFEIHSVV